MEARTSVSHPLTIDTVATPGDGRLGMTLLPGRNDTISAYGAWARDLPTDLDVIARWKPDLMVSLLAPHEYAISGQPDFVAIVGERPWPWYSLAIADGGIPDAAFDRAWESVGAQARRILQSGDKVLVHCRAGLGRTGTIAARLLIELGATPDAAMTAVRRPRPGTVETGAQERYLRSLTPVDVDPLRDRIYGMMLGAAIGDALGSAFEFLSSSDIQRILGSSVAREFLPPQPGSLLRDRGPGIPTDDTAMALALAGTLVDGRTPNPEDVERAFVDDLGSPTSRYGAMYWHGGPGGACNAMLRAFAAGAAPFEQINPDAGGNGAAMLAHPCGILPNRLSVAALAADQARLSHPHPAAVASAQAVALVVHAGLYDGTFSSDLPAEITDGQMKAAWVAAHHALDERGRDLPRHLRDVDMAGWNTVAAAHVIALRHRDDIETAIGAAAASGRDTDTVAGIVGAMLGAYHGQRALPQRWLNGLAYRETIESVAAALYDSAVRMRNVATLYAAQSLPASGEVLPAADAVLSQTNARESRAVSSAGELHGSSDRSPMAVSPTEPIELTSRFLRALIDAEHYHHEQRRKSTTIPYFSHVLGVCSLVLEARGTESEAIAALLHDAPEDCGGLPVLHAIEQNYGAEIGAIVHGLSDAFPLPGEVKAPYLERKQAYLDHLRQADASTMLVSAADKLHNLRAIQADYRELGDAVFDRFSAPPDKRHHVLWYYHSLCDVYEIPTVVARDSRMRRLATEIREILSSFTAQTLQARA